MKETNWAAMLSMKCGNFEQTTEEFVAQDNTFHNEECGYVIFTTCIDTIKHNFITAIGKQGNFETKKVLVEAYADKTQAKKGHMKWIKLIRSKPKSLYDIIEKREIELD